MYHITNMYGYLLLKDEHISDQQYRNIQERLEQYWDLDITEDAEHTDISLRCYLGIQDSPKLIATLDDLDVMLMQITNIGDDGEVLYGNIFVSLLNDNRPANVTGDDYEVLEIVYELFDCQSHPTILRKHRGTPEFFFTSLASAI